MFFFFFFQAEDGIRDLTVTGVQTCALPISGLPSQPSAGFNVAGHGDAAGVHRPAERRDGGSGDHEIGRAACRGRGEISVGAGSLKKKKKKEMKSVIDAQCARME